MSKRFTTKDTKKHEGKKPERRLIDAQVKELAIFPGLNQRRGIEQKETKATKKRLHDRENQLLCRPLLPFVLFVTFCSSQGFLFLYFVF